MGGDYEFTVPYTANYKLSLAGTQGSNYNSGAGGCGWSLVKDSITLNYGDVVDIHVPGWSNTYSSTESNGGDAAVLKVNDNTVWIAGAGAATVKNNIAQNGVTQYTAKGGNGATDGTDRTYTVHWHSSNGKSGATHSNSFPTVYSTAPVGGCYGWNGHTHNATGTCPMHHEHTNGCYELLLCCGGNTHGGTTGEGGVNWCPNWPNVVIQGDKHYVAVLRCSNELNTYDCGFYNNTQVLKCGYLQGQILGINNDNANAGTCYFADDWTPTSQSKTNADAASFKIELVEQQALFFSGSSVTPFPRYDKSPIYLLINDKRVVFFKRP